LIPPGVSVLVLLTMTTHMAAEDAIEQYKRTFVHDGEYEDDG
jgi:hypothetical protein